MILKSSKSISLILKIYYFFAFISFVLVLFGSKLLLIKHFGNATPFWDQWDAEAVRLYKPFLEGTLSIEELFSPHNEHRILTTRLLSLTLLKINGIWNPLLEMVVNSLIHIGAITVMAVMIINIVGKKMTPIVLLFSFILFAIPYAWENTLVGFQSQFYFLILFSIISIWLLILSKPFTLKWWIGYCIGILGYFSLASGVFIFATSGLVLLLQYILSLKRNKRILGAIGIIIISFIIGFYYTPIDRHQGLKATSFSQFFESIRAIMAWPLSIRIISPLIKNLPAITFLFVCIKRPLKINDKMWFLIAMITWMFAQTVSISYGRCLGNMISRYLDLYAIGVFINFACVLAIFKIVSEKKRIFITFALILWSIFIFYGLASYTINNSLAEIYQKAKTSNIQQTNCYKYIVTKNIAALEPKTKDDPSLMRGGYSLEIPYPNPNRLATYLDDLTIQRILPTNIRPPANTLSVHLKPEGSFYNTGVPHDLCSSEHDIFGSYSEDKNYKINGECIINYEATKNVSCLVIPIAGYPIADGIKIWIEQKGRHLPLNISTNPGDSWEFGYGKVANGDFSIHCNDFSKKSWLAVGAPIACGYLDCATAMILSNYQSVILVGIVCWFICVVLFTYTSFFSFSEPY